MKHTLLFIACVLASLAMSAQEELVVEDIQNSGCLKISFEEINQSLPTIVLTKEGSVLSVQLLNYETYDATTDFNVTSVISDDESCSVTINVTPVIPEGAEVEAEWVCLFNVSFTVRDLEPNKFYLDCWWFKGLVELTEGEPMVLEYKVKNATIDGISFKLLKAMHKAMLTNWTTAEEELHIPSEVNYEGEVYTVTCINKDAFWHVDHATKVTIPKTIRSMDFDYDGDIVANPFRECKSLEWIEVEDGCPLFSSVDGVLFAEEKTMLLGYPIASSRETYTVPDDVTSIRAGAFVHNMYLRKLVIPEEVTYLGWHLFNDTKSLEELYIKGVIEPECMSDLFAGMDTKVAVYVQPSEVEKYKAVYNGPVYPLTEQTIDDTADVKINETTFPDSNFRNWVLGQEYGADGVLTKEELENVTSLNISRLDIHNQKGLEYFTALKVLNCMTNKLTTLNLSKNTALEKLECNGNRLTTINLLKNNELRRLNCVSNSLTALDISGCTELDTLGCSSNQLTTLDVSKNTKLRCLECYSNLLTALDLSKNSALRRLHCSNNQLTTLDVSNNTALNLFVCSDNQLTTLDVTKNSALTNLTCMDNKLTTLYVSGNKSLENLFCFNNQLTSLDVSGCSALISLSCNDNQLATLNLSGCSALEEVNCSSNQLKTLDVSENTALTTLFCYQNQIKGIGMDALVESLPTVSDGRLNVMYFQNEQNVMTTTQVAAAKAKGWTPYIWAYSTSNEYVGSETIQDDYRPFVEDGKVWKVGDITSGNPAQCVEHFYFDGDTIIDGKTCKQMMCQRYVNPDFHFEQPALYYVGAWYEENQKVYYYDERKRSMVIKYDFSLNANDTLLLDNYPYVIGPKQTGGLKGFKGVYRDVRTGQNTRSTTWLEGVGGVDGPTRNAYPETADPVPEFLMSCTVGDEVIYLNDEVEDGTTPEGARKGRIDFTHTIKIKPKARITRGAETPLYAEYSNQQLGINLDPLDDAYLVRIADETGKTVYEKAVNAGNIVGLNIDISAYAEGRYTITIENSSETFTGRFETQPTGIEEAKSKCLETKGAIYDLQGRRLAAPPAKGVYIQDGRKVLK